jgi:hypothetical protein
MHVALVMRAADGRELARGEGTAPFLYRAVHDAVDKLRGPSGVPASDEPSPDVGAWLGTSAMSAVLDLQDTTIACRVEAVATCREECQRAKAHTELTPAMQAFVRSYCAVMLHEPPPGDLPPLDRSSGGSVVATAGGRIFADQNDAETDAALAEALDRETSPARRATLLCEQVLAASDSAVRRERGLLALQEDPEDADPRCSAWHDMPFAWTDTSYAPAYAAWAPWDSLAQDRLGDLEHQSLTYARRAYVLAPDQSAWSGSLCHRLFTAGLRVEAASILPHATAPYLQVEALAAEARFAASLDRAHALLSTSIHDRKPMASVFIAASEASVALVLERPPPDADAVVRAFVEAEPPRVLQAVNGFLGVITVCLAAPSDLAARCIARVDAAQKRGYLGGVFALGTGVIAGARRYVAHDFAGAAAAWKPLLRAPGDPLAPLRDAVANALDRSGDSELADKVDAPSVAGAGMFNGADLSVVRTALRAEKRGDHARARELAQRAVDAWAVADAPVPSLAAMRKILARP